MFWLSSINVNIISYSLSYIEANVLNDEQPIWRFVGLYGQPMVSNWWKTWDLVNDFCACNNLSLLICGDWNKVLFPSQKIREGIPKSQANMDNFAFTLRTNRLFNLGFLGFCFT